jgi:hypothetical protein
MRESLVLPPGSRQRHEAPCSGASPIQVEGFALCALPRPVLPHVLAHVVGVLLGVEGAPLTPICVVSFPARITSTSLVRVGVRGAVEDVWPQLEFVGHLRSSKWRERESGLPPVGQPLPRRGGRSRATTSVMGPDARLTDVESPSRST